MLFKLVPVPEMLSTVAPVPEMLFRLTPVPEMLFKLVPVPEMLSTVVPVPEMLFRLTPVPEMLFKLAPVPEMLSTVEPVPEILFRFTPVPEILFRLVPVPEILSTDTPVPEMLIRDSIGARACNSVAHMSPPGTACLPNTSIREPTRIARVGLLDIGAVILICSWPMWAMPVAASNDVTTSDTNTSLAPGTYACWATIISCARRLPSGVLTPAMEICASGWMIRIASEAV
jgi:hypothetical protein